MFCGDFVLFILFSQHCKGGTPWTTWSLCWGSVLCHSQMTNPLNASHHRFHCPSFKMALLQVMSSVHQQFPQGQYLRVMVTLSRCHEFTLVLFSLELVEACLNKILLLWFPVCINNWMSRLSLWLATFCQSWLPIVAILSCEMQHALCLFLLCLMKTEMSIIIKDAVCACELATWQTWTYKGSSLLSLLSWTMGRRG